MPNCRSCLEYRESVAIGWPDGGFYWPCCADYEFKFLNSEAVGSFLRIARALWKNMNGIVHEDGSGLPQQIHSEVQVLLCGLCPMLTQAQPFSINQGCSWKPPPSDW